jgi:hypothetical protein
MGWDPYIVRRELRDLDKRSIPGFKLGVLVEFKDLSFHVLAPGDLSDEEMDEVIISNINVLMAIFLHSHQNCMNSFCLSYAYRERHHSLTVKQVI